MTDIDPVAPAAVPGHPTVQSPPAPATLKGSGTGREVLLSWIVILGGFTAMLLIGWHFTD